MRDADRLFWGGRAVYERYRDHPERVVPDTLLLTVVAAVVAMMAPFTWFCVTELVRTKALGF